MIERDYGTNLHQINVYFKWAYLAERARHCLVPFFVGLLELLPELLPPVYPQPISEHAPQQRGHDYAYYGMLQARNATA